MQTHREQSTNEDSSSPADPTRGVKSDHLVELRQFFEDHAPFLNTIRPLFEMEIIIDANVVIKNLIWLTKLRKKHDARTSLQEVLAAGWQPQGVALGMADKKVGGKRARRCKA